MSQLELLSLASGQKFSVSLKAAKHSEFLWSAHTLDPDSTEPVPIIAVEDDMVIKCISFLEQFALDPFVRVKRPIQKGQALGDIGFPEWAIAMINAEPLNTTLLDLAEAAVSMRVTMLEQLCYARIAFEVNLMTMEELRGMSTRSFTPEEERLLKEQNKWAWESPAEDVVVEVEKDGKEAAGSSGGASACAESCVTTSTPTPNIGSIKDILLDPRIKCKNTTGEEFRLTSTIAGGIALYLD